MFGGIKRVSNDMQFGICYPTHTRYVRRSFQPLSESHLVLTTYAIQAHTSLVAYRIMLISLTALLRTIQTVAPLNFGRCKDATQYIDNQIFETKNLKNLARKAKAAREKFRGDGGAKMGASRHISVGV